MTQTIDIEKLAEETMDRIAKGQRPLINSIHKLICNKIQTRLVADLMLTYLITNPKEWLTSENIILDFAKEVSIFTFELGRLYGRQEIINETLEKME